ncbi:MAG: hypothetical protein M3O09_09045 [Acidobacteriota bacterium]|nr:hypothetical protein [Acidobacteriota bacterium]
MSLAWIQSAGELDKTIDDLSYHGDRVAAIFQEYLNRGKKDGEWVLRHKNGRPVLIEYSAYVFPDGCIAAAWKPISPTDMGRQAKEAD